MDKLYFAYNRFGVGVRPSENHDPKMSAVNWVADQLSQPVDMSAFAGIENTAKLATYSRDLRMARQKDKRAKNGTQTNTQFAQKEIRTVTRRQYVAHIRQSINTKTPVLEKLALFWGNHFAVSATNNQVRPYVPAFQREAIYPNISGTFYSMLVAAVTHPAMLAYLDNHISVGPNSRFGQKRKKGLNENLGREILELHTMGTSGGYTIQDIQGLAKILTGWTIQRKMKADNFQGTTFNTAMHEPGSHTLLGESFDQNGAKKLVKALKKIAQHPSTATYIATKLATRFISDNPSKKHIAAIAKAFTNSKGHLPTVHAVTFDLALQHGKPFSKARSHHDYVIAMARALDLKNDMHPRLLKLMAGLGQAMFAPPGPDGWPDNESSWITPQGLIRRIKLAQFIARRMRKKDARALSTALFGDNISKNTMQHIMRAESPQQGLVIALASQEMNYV